MMCGKKNWNKNTIFRAPQMTIIYVHHCNIYRIVYPSYFLSIANTREISERWCAPQKIKHVYLHCGSMRRPKIREKWKRLHCEGEKLLRYVCFTRRYFSLFFKFFFFSFLITTEIGMMKEMWMLISNRSEEQTVCKRKLHFFHHDRKQHSQMKPFCMNSIRCMNWLTFALCKDDERL